MTDRLSQVKPKVPIKKMRLGVNIDPVSLDTLSLLVEVGLERVVRVAMPAMATIDLFINPRLSMINFGSNDSSDINAS